MHGLELLHRLFINKMPGVHRRRMDSLLSCVATLIETKTLSLTSLGRHMSGNAKVRSNIKKVDRLLGNLYLHGEREGFYASMISELLGDECRPLISIDWSCISAREELYVLRASWCVDGRAIVLWEEVHPKSHENNHQAHKKFLTKLRTLLPKGIRPILITDAGFRGLWFIVARQTGYDFLGRVRNNNAVMLSDIEQWQDSRSLYAKATRKAQCLGRGLLTKTHELKCRFALFKANRKSRKSKNLDGTPKQQSKSLRYANGQSEGWLLATSLNEDDYSACELVSLYKKRMQIEENFRDTKSIRYGFALNLSGTKSVERMSILLLIAAISTFLCWLAGITVKVRGKAADYQAHSAKFTHALSVVFLGCEALRNMLYMKIDDYKDGLLLMRQLANGKFQWGNCHV